MPRNNKEAPQPTLNQKLAAEIVGTFFVTLVPTAVDIAYYTTGHIDDVSRWLARGFITAAMIYSFSECSGAHIDPAISLGFTVRGVFPVRKLVPYVIAQFAGGFLAAFLIWLWWRSTIALGASHPGPGQPAGLAFATEIVLTFLVMMVIFATAEYEAAVGRHAALAVGFTVAACGFAGGSISGASMNPARSIPPELFGGSFSIVWIYLFAPCLGAVLAALVAPLIFGRPAESEAKAARGG
ncbi:MAG: aquaporin family protein [Candidatus Eremiobacteraeota bacterium]|nr:aquaporin family protein [Candidatus Eremiobacteraeota bacterium]